MRARYWILWVPVSVTGIIGFRAWPQLPRNVAIHFNWQLEPDLWLPKAVAATVVGHVLVGITLVASIVCAWVGRPVLGTAVSVLWVSGVCVATVEAVLYNAQGTVPHVWLAGALFAVAIGLTFWRNPWQDSTVSNGGIVCEQVHRSWPQATFFVALWIPFFVAMFVAESPALLVLVPVNLVLLYAAGVFVGGFRYRLSAETLEVRNVFRRIESFRMSELQSYEVVKTSGLADWGGWGVRGWGIAKAYLLGGDRAVRLTFRNRQVSLGLKNTTGVAESIGAILSKGV